MNIVGTPLPRKPWMMWSGSPGWQIRCHCHTGSGKSTLIQHFNGLIAPQARCMSTGRTSRKRVSISRSREKNRNWFLWRPEYQLFEKPSKDVAFGRKTWVYPRRDHRRSDGPSSGGPILSGIDKSPLNYPAVRNGGSHRRRRRHGTASLILDDQPRSWIPRDGRSPQAIKLHYDYKMTTIWCPFHGGCGGYCRSGHCHAQCQIR